MNNNNDSLFSRRGEAHIDSKLTSNVRPNTSSSSLLTKNPRLDIYPSVRQLKPYSEIRYSSNLGPGSYDFQEPYERPKTTGNGSGFTISRTIIHPDHSIIRRSAAPPVGTYNVPRIMSPLVPGSELGTQISSSFLNGGRKSYLINDAVHYNTMREDIKMSNLGPGTYDLPDNWAPAAFSKYNKKPGKPVERKYNHNSYDKPWKTFSSSTLQKYASKVKENSNAESRMDMSINKDELNSEILRVKRLPNY